MGRSRGFPSGRRVRRVVTPLVSVATTLVVTAAPALANIDDGESRPKSLGVALTLLIYIGIPVGAFLVISLFSVAPSLLRRPRYRPGSWSHDPLWFAGPDQPDAALAAARPGMTAKGGAHGDW